MKNDETAQTLIDAEKSIDLEIKGITGADQLKHKLEYMGIRAGKRIIKLSSRKSGGPVIISLAGASSQIALGRGMAKKIIVENHYTE